MDTGMISEGLFQRFNNPTGNKVIVLVSVCLLTEEIFFLQTILGSSTYQCCLYIGLIDERNLYSNFHKAFEVSDQIPETIPEFLFVFQDSVTMDSVHTSFHPLFITLSV